MLSKASSIRQWLVRSKLDPSWNSIAIASLTLFICSRIRWHERCWQGYVWWWV